MLKKFFSSVVVVALLITTTGILNPTSAMAASITTATDAMSVLTTSVVADHTIMFVTPSGVASGGTIAIAFSAGFTGVGSMVVGDFDFAVNSGSVCTAGSWTEQSLKASPGAADWSVAGASQTVTITSGGASATVAAGRCIRLKAGLNATDTTGSTGPGSHQIANPTAGTATLTISVSSGDSGIISVPIIDSSAVSVTATVNGSITFDLNAGLTSASNASPYTIPLGILSAASVTHSDNSGIKSIWASASSNSAGGMNVSVRNTNGANGLVSASVNGDKIPATGATMSAGTAMYGICVNTTGLVGWTKGTTYNTTCAANSATNVVPALSSTATDILTSTAPLASGAAEIIVNATISTVTPAHSDYADTLYFIATSSF